MCRPYFGFDSLGSGETIERKKVIKEGLVAHLPIDINPTTFELAIRCFASICYHYEELNTDMHKNCIPQSAAVFKDIPRNILDVAVIAYPWTKT